MFSLLTRTNVEVVSGREITDFLLGCNDAGLPELVARHDRRPPRQAEVRAGGLVPGRTLVWQLHRPLFRLPVRLVLRLNDDDTGVQIEQQWSVGRLALGC